MIAIPNIDAYSSARRISSAVATGRPSSERATQPAPFSSAMSASSSPREPRETAPIGYTRASPASFAFFRMYDVTFASSLIGSVFGMQATAEKPPATAALVPVATVSLCSCPGSRRCTCMSMNPGQTTSPLGISTTSAPSTGRSRATRSIRSPSISTSNAPSMPPAGSTTRPPLSSFFMLGSAGQQVEDGHPDGHAVGDLIENHGERTVRDFRRNLHPSIHRARVHDDRVRPRAPHALLRHPEDIEILAQGGKESALHPFELNAQQHDDVRILDGLLDHARRPHAEACDIGRDERGRTADPDVGVKLGQQVDVRPQHAAVQEIPDDGDRLSSQRGNLLDRPRSNLLHRFSRLKDQHDLFRRELRDAEEILPAQGGEGRRLWRGGPGALGGHGWPSCWTTTSSWPSVSCRRTCTLSLGDVGRVLPT